MPINYVAPSPITFGSRFANSGGGLAGNIAAQNSLDQQAALQMQDRHFAEGMVEKQREQNMSMMPSSRDEYLASVQSAQQEQKAELAAWLSQQEMTQADVMKTKQQQNAVSQIMSDNTLSPNEKQNAITQLRSGIDFNKQRMQNDRAKAESEMYQAHAKQFTAQADLARNKNIFDAQSMSGQSKTEIADSAIPELTDYMKDAHPELKPGTPEYQSKMEMQAIRIGAGRKYVIDPKTGGKIADPYELERLKHRWSAGADAMGGGAGAPSGTGGDLSEAAYLKHFEAAKKSTHDWAKLQVTPPSEDQMNAHFQQDMAALEKARNDFHASSPAAKAQEAQKAVLGKIAVQEDEVKSMPGLSDQERTVGQKLVGEIKRLTTKYPPGKLTPAINDRLNALQDQYEQMQKITAMRSQGLIPGFNQQPAAPGQSQPVSPPVPGRGNRPAQLGNSPQEDYEYLVKQALAGVVGAKEKLKELFPHNQMFR